MISSSKCLDRLRPKQLDPFAVIARIVMNAFRFCLPHTMQMYAVFHARYLGKTLADSPLVAQSVRVRYP